MSLVFCSDNYIFVIQPEQLNSYGHIRTNPMDLTVILRNNSD